MYGTHIATYIILMPAIPSISFAALLRRYVCIEEGAVTADGTALEDACDEALGRYINAVKASSQSWMQEGAGSFNHGCICYGRYINAVTCTFQICTLKHSHRNMHI